MDDTKRQGETEEKGENNKPDLPDEENAIEMSEDFDGALHDLEADGDDDNDDGEHSGEEEEAELDRKMGEVDGQDADKLDQKLWEDPEGERESQVGPHQLTLMLGEFSVCVCACVRACVCLCACLCACVCACLCISVEK